jgi:hypothetical protein
MWIVSAIQRALQIHAGSPLDVHLVHFMQIPKGGFDDLEKKFGAGKQRGKKKKKKKEEGGEKKEEGEEKKSRPAKPVDFGEEHLKTGIAGVNQHRQLREPDTVSDGGNGDGGGGGDDGAAAGSTEEGGAGKRSIASASSSL